jgi:succinate dehydrogenase hydrophobic anchor subunit
MARAAPRAGAPKRSGSGSGAFRWTALSGVALLVLLTIHMVANHFVIESVGGLRSYRQVIEYIGDPLILVVETLFLIVVTMHAMLGLRSVIFDFGLSDRAQRWVDRSLTVLGVATVVYGLVLLSVLASRA